MSLEVDLVLAVSAGIVLTLLSTIEIAYGQLSDVSLHLLRAGARAAGQEAFFDDLIGHDERFRSTLRVGIHSTVIVIAILTLRALQQASVGHSLIIAFLVAANLVFLFRLFIPRLIVQNGPVRVFLAMLPIVKPYYKLVSLLIWPIEHAIQTFRRPTSDDAGLDEPSIDETMSDIQAFIDVGEEEGIIAEAEGMMIQSIVELGDTSVREIMTPRTQIVAIKSDATVADARDLIVTCKFSRLPVFSEQIDNVEGVLYVRDLIVAWANAQEGEPVTSIMRPAYFVPETKAVGDLLEEMRKSKVQIGIVIDEYGAVAGLITIEDLLEEIVGEIEDEDVQASTEDIVQEAAGSVLVKGSTEIRKVELEFGVELEADDFTTVAGLIINELGHLPSRGERLEFRGIGFEVVEADSRRVNLVRLRTLAPPERGESREAATEG